MEYYRSLYNRLEFKYVIFFGLFLLLLLLRSLIDVSLHRYANQFDREGIEWAAKRQRRKFASVQTEVSTVEYGRCIASGSRPVFVNKLCMWIPSRRRVKRCSTGGDSYDRQNNSRSIPFNIPSVRGGGKHLGRLSIAMQAACVWGSILSDATFLTYVDE